MVNMTTIIKTVDVVYHVVSMVNMTTIIKTVDVVYHVVSMVNMTTIIKTVDVVYHVVSMVNMTTIIKTVDVVYHTVSMVNMTTIIKTVDVVYHVVSMVNRKNKETFSVYGIIAIGASLVSFSPCRFFINKCMNLLRASENKKRKKERNGRGEVEEGLGRGV